MTSAEGSGREAFLAWEEGAQHPLCSARQSRPVPPAGVNMTCSGTGKRCRLHMEERPQQRLRLLEEALVKEGVRAEAAEGKLEKVTRDTLDLRMLRGSLTLGQEILGESVLALSWCACRT